MLFHRKSYDKLALGIVWRFISQAGNKALHTSLAQVLLDVAKESNFANSLV